MRPHSPLRTLPRLAFAALSVLLVAAPLGAQSGDNAPDLLKAALLRINITPEEPVRLAGYAGRDELSTGVHDSLFARILALESGSKRLVIVSTDILGYYDGTSAIFREAIQSAHGLDASELFLGSIHTHAGPSLTLDPTKGPAPNVAYTRSLQEKLVGAVGVALSGVQPTRLKVGTGSSPVGVNRREVYRDSLGNPRVWLGRNPPGVHDREVQVLALESDAGTTGVLFNYSVHSTSLGWQNYLISGDIHGTAERFVERFLGEPVVAPAFAGTSGDIDPWYRVLPSFETRNGWVPETVLLGTLLGEEVVHTLSQATDVDLAAGLASTFVTSALPGKPSGELRTPPGWQDTPLALGVARVGDVGFVCLGGEILTDIGLAIKAASPFPVTFVLSHCNGTAGYLPPARLYHEGGYEIESSPFAPTAADAVVKRVSAMLHAL